MTVLNHKAATSLNHVLGANATSFPTGATIASHKFASLAGVRSSANQLGCSPCQHPQKAQTCLMYTLTGSPLDKLYSSTSMPPPPWEALHLCTVNSPPDCQTASLRIAPPILELQPSKRSRPPNIKSCLASMPPPSPCAWQFVISMVPPCTSRWPAEMAPPE